MEGVKRNENSAEAEERNVAVRVGQRRREGGQITSGPVSALKSHMHAPWAPKSLRILIAAATSLYVGFLLMEVLSFCRF